MAMDFYLKDRLDNIIQQTSEDEVLDEIGYSNVMRWIHSSDLAKYDYYTVTDNKEAISALKAVGEYISPHRYLDKNDLKKEICDFIDFWL